MPKGKPRFDLPLPLGEPIKGKTLRADGWVYRDIPGRLSLEMWDHLMDVIGAGNCEVLALSIGDDWVRGQLMISPDGMKNLAAFREHQ